MHSALEIDPTSANFLADMGQMYYFARQYEDAERYCRKALEMSPDFVFAHSYLYDICLQTGRTDEALEEFVKFAASFLSSGSKYEATPSVTTVLKIRKSYQEKLLREGYQQAGIKGLWRYIINIEQSSRALGFAYGLAKSYALMKDQQQTLNWLEKSYENREFFMPSMKSDPVFSDLHSQPRYQEILRKMNLN